MAASAKFPILGPSLEWAVESLWRMAALFLCKHPAASTVQRPPCFRQTTTPCLYALRSAIFLAPELITKSGRSFTTRPLELYPQSHLVVARQAHLAHHEARQVSKPSNTL